MSEVADSHFPTPSQTQRLTGLCNVLEKLARANTIDDLYETVIGALLSQTSADRLAILAVDVDQCHSGHRLQFHAARNLSPACFTALNELGPADFTSNGDSPLAMPDVLSRRTFSKHRNAFESEGVRGFAAMPFALPGGVPGKLVLFFPDHDSCTADELAIAQVIAQHTSLAAKLLAAHAQPTAAPVLGANTGSWDAAGVHLAAIVESSDDAIISKNLNGIITSWNKGAERIFGYSAAEAIGKPVAMLAPPLVLNEMPDILGKIRSGERVDHYETLRRTKDGEIINVSLTVSPVRDASGRVIGASKIARDISDRKRAEKERAVLLAREQEARSTAELLNRAGPILAVELDHEKLVQAITDIATQLVAAEFGSFFHNVVDERGESYMLYTLSGAPREAFQDFPMPRNTGIFAPTFRGEGIVRCEDVSQDPRYGKNPPYSGMPPGHLPVRSYLAVPVVSRSGEVLGGLFFGHSQPGRFSEQHEALLKGIAAQAAIAIDNARLFEQAQWAQQELKRSNEELRRANQDLETFAYSASHDLQEPLRTVAISAQLLARRYREQLSSEGTRFVNDIVQGALRMETLIRDILAYATAAKFPEGAPVAVSAGEVLAAVLETLRPRIEEANATITAGDLPVVSVHENRLVQVFQNLIGNALKYRRGAARVQISAVERDGWCIFSVVDNGIGIDPKFADHIFGLFKRLHGREEYPGSGIGLAICQRIVEQYGGRIWLEHSVPGEGSTFSFTFPARPR